MSVLPLSRAFDGFFDVNFAAEPVQLVPCLRDATCDADTDSNHARRIARETSKAKTLRTKRPISHYNINGCFPVGSQESVYCPCQVCLHEGIFTCNSCMTLKRCESCVQGALGKRAGSRRNVCDAESLVKLLLGPQLSGSGSFSASSPGIHLFEILWFDFLNGEFIPSRLQLDSMKACALRNVENPKLEQFWEGFGEIIATAVLLWYKMLGSLQLGVLQSGLLSLLGEEETIRHHTPVRNLSLPKEIRDRKHRFWSYFWSPDFYRVFVSTSTLESLPGGQESFPTHCLSVVVMVVYPLFSLFWLGFPNRCSRFAMQQRLDSD